MQLWLLTAHLIGVILWMGCLFAVYWLLRVHAQAPKDVLDRLTLMERSLAMTMDMRSSHRRGSAPRSPACGSAHQQQRRGRTDQRKRQRMKR